MCRKTHHTSSNGLRITADIHHVVMLPTLLHLVVWFPRLYHHNLYAILFSPILCPTYVIILDLIILIILGGEYKSCSFLLCSFLPIPVTSSLFGPNISLSTLFSNTLSLCSSLNIRDQVSHPYRTKGKIRVLYILMITFLNSRWEDMFQERMVASIIRILSPSNFLLN
jgi:hypothetical protein